MSSEHGSGWFRAIDDGIELAVRLTPKAARDAVEGVKISADGKAHLAARVRAVPEDGKANKALELLVAKSLGVPKSAVSVVAGHTSRLKTVLVASTGRERDALARKVAGLA